MDITIKPRLLLSALSKCLSPSPGQVGDFGLSRLASQAQSGTHLDFISTNVKGTVGEAPLGRDHGGNHGGGTVSGTENAWTAYMHKVQ